MKNKHLSNFCSSIQISEALDGKSESEEKVIYTFKRIQAINNPKTVIFKIGMGEKLRNNQGKMMINNKSQYQWLQLCNKSRLMIRQDLEIGPIFLLYLKNK